MPVDPIMPLTYMQDMGPTAKLVHDASVRPDAAQAMAKIMAEEMLREENKQVQKSQPGEQSTAINGEGGGGGQGAMHQERRQAQEEKEDAPPSESADPFVGKLVNRKI
jgi:hypothetical protein